jgi:hypothetical protein
MYRCNGCNSSFPSEKGWKQHTKTCKQERERITKLKVTHLIGKKKDEKHAPEAALETLQEEDEIEEAAMSPKGAHAFNNPEMFNDPMGSQHEVKLTFNAYLLSLIVILYHKTC